MPHRAIHLSDLHLGKRQLSAVADALAALAAELRPELVFATGDLAHRGTRTQLEEARALLESLGVRTLAVPGNHDLPYTFPARFTRPWVEFVRAFGSTDPVVRSEAIVAVGLNSARPWRHQGGGLSRARLERAAHELADAPAGALRVVALHHHLVGAPWRASRKLPLSRRDRALSALAAARAELVVGGHIHQSSTAERHEFVALEEKASGSLVLATAPGFGRPRPQRTGEAQGLHVYEWDAEQLVVITRAWDGAVFAPTARREFPRR